MEISLGYDRIEHGMRTVFEAQNSVPHDPARLLDGKDRLVAIVSPFYFATSKILHDWQRSETPKDKCAETHPCISYPASYRLLLHTAALHGGVYTFS